MEKPTEKALLEEFKESLENSLQQKIVEKYLRQFSIEDVEAFIKELVFSEVKESEA